MMKVIKGIIHVIACYFILVLVQPFIYNFAAYIGQRFTSGMFEATSFLVGLSILYGFFTLICYGISYLLGTKASAIISTIMCIIQIIYYNIKLTMYNGFSVVIVASWIAIVLVLGAQSVAQTMAVQAKMLDKQ